mmetsp:Transcript_18227/g.41418  ORF Transcript_18227/g.41418 Transcript_18227/m.41418 type:complete len:210 (+) Transcript_18227:1142-1771(+)
MSTLDWKELRRLCFDLLHHKEMTLTASRLNTFLVSSRIITPIAVFSADENTSRFPRAAVVTEPRRIPKRAAADATVRPMCVVAMLLPGPPLAPGVMLVKMNQQALSMSMLEDFSNSFPEMTQYLAQRVEQAGWTEGRMRQAEVSAARKRKPARKRKRSQTIATASIDDQPDSSRFSTKSDDSRTPVSPAIRCRCGRSRAVRSQTARQRR